MFVAIYTEILGEIVDSDVGLLITFASKQDKLVPPRINVVRHDLQVGLLTTFASQQHKRIPPRISLVSHNLHEVLIK